LDEQSLSFRLLAILFPIFGIVAAGYFYGRKHKPEMAVANRLNMDVFVPALVFAAMAGKSFDLAAYAPLALGGFLVLATCGLLAWPIARLVGIQPKTLVPPMLFNNSGNIGLPLAVLAWGEMRCRRRSSCSWSRTRCISPSVPVCSIRRRVC
jgi:predicted permease